MSFSTDFDFISGPMRGYPEYNFPAFEECCEYLESQMHYVKSPHRRDLAKGFDPNLSLGDQLFKLDEAMAWDLQQVTRCGRLVLLPGWRQSHGATLEYSVARACGRKVYEYHPTGSWGHRLSFLPELRDETILEEAARLTSEDRNRAYGHPADDWAATSAIWSVWLRRKYGADAPTLDAHDVAWMMAGLKLSREAHRSSRDNAVDVCGYLRGAEMVYEQENH